MKGKIEVVEVFGYWCIHCAHFQPAVDAWKRKLPSDVRFTPCRRRSAATDPFARAYFAAERSRRARQDPRRAVRCRARASRRCHQNASSTKSPGSTPRRASTRTKAFEGRHGEPGVDAQLEQAKEFALRSGIAGTPTLVVNGKYRVEGRDRRGTLRIAERADRDGAQGAAIDCPSRGSAPATCFLSIHCENLLHEQAPDLPADRDAGRDHRLQSPGHPGRGRRLLRAERRRRRQRIAATASFVAATCRRCPPPHPIPPRSRPPSRGRRRAAGRLARPGTGRRQDYIEMQGGQPFDPLDGKIEVVEVFGYVCPACARFQPLVSAWKRKLPADVRFTYVPALFGGTGTAMRSAFYAAESMGLVDKTHRRRVQRDPHRARCLPKGERGQDSDQDIAAFYGSTASTRSSSLSTMASFAVDAKLNKAKQFAMRSEIEGTPTLVVNGKYLVKGKSFEDMLRIADQLIAQGARGARRRSAGSAAAAAAALTAADTRRLKLLSANIQAGSSTRRYSDYATRSWSHVLPAGNKRGSLDTIAQAGRRARHRRPAGKRSGQPALGVHQPDALPRRARRLRLLEPPAQPPRRQLRLQRQRPAEQARTGRSHRPSPCPAASPAAAC